MVYLENKLNDLYSARSEYKMKLYELEKKISEKNHQIKGIKEMCKSSKEDLDLLSTASIRKKLFRKLDIYLAMISTFGLCTIVSTSNYVISPLMAFTLAGLSGLTFKLIYNFQTEKITKLEDTVSEEDLHEEIEAFKKEINDMEKELLEKYREKTSIESTILDINSEIYKTRTIIKRLKNVDEHISEHITQERDVEIPNMSLSLKKEK